MSRNNLVSVFLHLFSTVFLRRIPLFIFAVCFNTGILQAQSDTQPPQLLSLSVSPATVDVTASDQVVTFTAHITDNLSGVSFASITLVSPSSSQRPFNLSIESIPDATLDAVVHVPVTIQRYSEQGTWSIDLVLGDKAGNLTSMDKSALIAAGFPATVQVQDANSDITPPQLLSFTFSPSSVDVSSGPQIITFESVLTDDLSGVSGGGIFVTSSKQGQGTGMQLVAGTITNGTFRATLTIPRYSEPGVWKVSAAVFDSIGNQQLYDAAALAALGFSNQLTVSSNPFDVTPPRLTGLSFTPSLINTSLSNQDVEVELAITDDLSGVRFDFLFDFPPNMEFNSPSGAQIAFPSVVSDAPPISGVPTNGRWGIPITFRRFSEEGTWKLNGVLLRDRVGNAVFYNPTQLAALGLPTDLIVIRPSLVPDGTISNPAAGGSISDNTFGDRAKVTVAPGILSESTTIAIDILQSPLQVPLPVGFSGAETYFVNVEFLPTPTFPLTAPGLTLVLPLRNYTIPGTSINLFRIDPATGNLVQALNTSGVPVVGRVDASGLTATFFGVSRLSTVVGLLATAVPVRVAVQQRTINTKSHGSIPVVIFSSPTLDATKIDPATLHFAGASVETRGHLSFQISTHDRDGDGRPDLLAHFKTEELRLTRADTEAVLEGRTFDNRLIRGVAKVKILK